MSPERALAMARVLRNRLQWALHTGTMRAGDRLPSVRELAAEFGADARTALRACKLLAEEGLIEMRKRSGMYVSLPASAPPPLSSPQRAIADIFVHGLTVGIAPARLPDVLREQCSRRRVRVLCIESNADHAAAISAVVRDTFGVDAVTASVADVLSDPRPAFHDVDAAVATAFHASDVRRAAEPLGVPVFIATVDPAQGSEFIRSVENRPIYVIGTDRRWAERAAGMFSASAAEMNLHVVVIGEDDLQRIPANAEVFATPSAALHLAELSVSRPVRVLRYVLSTADARGLISTIVAANDAV